MLSYIKRFFNTNLSFLIILMVVIFSLYGKVINFEALFFDDNQMITNNMSYVSSIKNIPNLFLQDCYYSNNHNYYRPILTLSFALETIIFGYNTKIYHFTNVILFILSFYLMFIFLAKLNLNKNISKLILLLFSVHPILMSLPAWIAARNDTLITIFVLLFFISFLNYIKTNKQIYRILYYLFFAIALLTKETGIAIIPVYLLFLCFYDIRITKKQLLTDFSFFIIITFIYFIFRNLSIGKTILNIFNFKTILTNCFHEFLIYNKKMFIPEHIPIVLYTAKINISSLSISFFMFIALLFAFVKKIIPRRKLIFGLFWFLIFLIPTFFTVKEQILFHRLMLPFFGIYIILITLIEQIIIKHPNLKKYFIIFYVILFFTLSYSSYIQCDKYHDNTVFTLNFYLDSKESTNYLALLDLLIENGNLNEAKKILSERVKEGASVDEMFYLAKLFFAYGDFEQAENICLLVEKVLSPQEKHNIFVLLSEIYYIKEQYDKAYEYIKEAYKTNPHSTNILKQFARIAEKTEIAQALDIYKRLSEIDKSNKEYKNKISLLEQELKKID